MLKRVYLALIEKGLENKASFIDFKCAIQASRPHGKSIISSSQPLHPHDLTQIAGQSAGRGLQELCI